MAESSTDGLVNLDRGTFIFVVGLILALVWLILAVVGDHPDGAVLGFAGTLLLVSGMGKQTSHKLERMGAKRRYQENGNDDDDDETYIHVGRG